jgi:hypothetical protein
MSDPPTISDLLGGAPYAIEIPRPQAVTWPPTALLGAETLNKVNDFSTAGPHAIARDASDHHVRGSDVASE